VIAAVRSQIDDGVEPPVGPELLALRDNAMANRDIEGADPLMERHVP
jgi:hypothetical protein